jgi:outer membrane protein TolC
LRRTRTETSNIGLTFQQTIFDLTAIPAYRLGRLTAQAAQLTYRSTIRQVLFGLSQAYYEVLKQQRVAVVSRETLVLAQQQLKLAQTRADVGEVTRSDVLRAQVAVEGNRQTLIAAENTLASKRNILRNILNLRETAFVVVEPPAYSPVLAPFETLIVRALDQREDLRVQSIAIGQDIERRNGVAAEYGPKIVAQLSGDRSTVSGTSESRSHSWDATLSVQLPFLTGGQREIDLLRAGYQIKQTRLDYDIFAKNVQQEVKDAWLLVSTLEQTLRAVRIQVQAAQQAYEDIRNQYEAGTATSVDLLTALNELDIARRDLATQSYDYQVALRNVEEVTGVFQDERVNRMKFR